MLIWLILAFLVNLITMSLQSPSKEGVVNKKKIFLKMSWKKILKIDFSLILLLN